MTDERSELPPEMAKQVDQLDRAKRLSDRLWGWTNVATLPILGTLSATLGLSFAAGTGSWPVVLITAAAISALLSGVLHVVADVIIASRRRVLQKKELPTTRLRWVVIPMGIQAVLFLAAFSAWGSAIGLAVANAVEEDPLLDKRLADRVEAYDEARDDADKAKIVEAEGKIDAFCTEHLEDDKATNVFREICGLFQANKLPGGEDTEKLLKRLKE